MAIENTSDSLGEIAPKRYKSFSPVMIRVNACKKQRYALFLCQDRNWNPVVGQRYSMQLEGFSNYVIEGEVESFTRIGSDLLLRMRVDSSVEPVLNIRTCAATVGDFVSGFSVPINALYTYDNQIGVVVLDGGMQTFVAVTVISYEDENTAFVRPTLSGSPLESDKTVMLF